MAAAIIDGDRVLAIRRRDNDKWEPPGGTLEPTETIVSGLRREVMEEIGIAVDPRRLSGVYKNMEKGIVALVFQCSSPSAEPSLSAEVAEVRWLHREEIPNFLDPAYACRLLDALSESSPAICSHDGVSLIDREL